MYFIGKFIGALFLPPLVTVTILVLLPATFSAALVIRRHYVLTLLKVFEVRCSLNSANIVTFVVGTS